jgi:hypothetical protein
MGQVYTDNTLTKTLNTHLTETYIPLTDKGTANGVATLDNFGKIPPEQLREVDPNEVAYFNYASNIYGDKYNLLANAWQDMKDSETVLFNIPLTLAEPNQEMAGMTVDLYVGTNGQLQALYDACANETITPNNVYYVNNVATYYEGDVSGVVSFPIPLYQFGAFGANSENASFLIGNLTPLSIGLSLVLVKPVGVSIPNNNIVIQQGFEFENENGIIIPNTVTSINEQAFADWTSNNQPLVIPNSVTNIRDGTFGNWTSNNQPLVIPNSVTNIGGWAFYNWTSNNQPLVIPDSVTNIGDWTFKDWTANNQPLVIPNSVTHIGIKAFENWTLVPYVEMKGTTPPSLINANAFANQNNAPIYVPDESVEAYKTAPNWEDLADRIFPISDKAGIVDNLTTNDATKVLSAKQGKILQDNKVDKTLTIIGLDLQDNILLGEFKTALGNATQSLSGLMSATDKQRLDVLHALLEEDTSNSVVDSINEILAIFNNYPEGADLVSALAGKVDKIAGKGLSENDLTDTLKSNYDTAYTHSQSTHAPANAQKNSDITKAEIEAKLTGEISSHSHALPTHNHTKSEITDFPTIPTVPTISNNIAEDAENTSKTTSPKAVKDYVDNAISSIIGGLEDLGAFPDETALITHILTNNTPSGIYQMQYGDGHQIINILNNSENVLVSILSENLIAFIDFNKVSMEIEYFRTLSSHAFIEATQAQLVDGSVVDTMQISPKTFKDSVNALIANALPTHNHDDRYYTETEINTKLSGKANATHNHDSDYYKKTEAYSKTEIDNMIGNIDAILDSILGV